MTTTAPITEHVLTLASGHQLRYATRGAGLPIAVVFVHGWPDSWRSFEPVLDALPPTTSAVSVSLRGFGGSDAPPDGYTPDDFAADVRELSWTISTSRRRCSSGTRWAPSSSSASPRRTPR